MAPSSHLFTKNMTILFQVLKKKNHIPQIQVWEIENLSLYSLSYLPVQYQRTVTQFRKLFLLSSHCQTAFTNFFVQCLKTYIELRFVWSKNFPGVYESTCIPGVVEKKNNKTRKTLGSTFVAVALAPFAGAENILFSWNSAWYQAYKCITYLLTRWLW